MKLDEALTLAEESFKRRIEIRKKKGRDYANDEDILANFKATADVCKVLAKHNMPVDVTTAHGVALYYSILKLLRRLNLYAKGVKPENESLIDTFDDAANKIFLEGHKGAHTNEYKQYVLDYLQGATNGLKGEAYEQALRGALDDLGQQLLLNPGMPYKGGL